MAEKLKQEDVINRFKDIHGDRYDYSEVMFTNNKNKVIIICKEHGRFEQSPEKHGSGQGCKLCKNKNLSMQRTMWTEDKISSYIEKFNGIKYIKSYRKNGAIRIVIYCIIHKQYRDCILSHHINRKIKGCGQCIIDNQSKENNYQWRQDISEEERLQKRDIIENKIWRNNVYENDGYICQICGCSSGNKNAHHLNGYHWFKEGRFNPDNGITLCEKCHKEFHKLFGNRNNTEQQFVEFYKYKLFKGGIECLD